MPTDDNLTRYSFCEERIVDGIKDTYQQWTIRTHEKPRASASRVFIESPTGTGKTTFILKTLLPYAAQYQRKILYLSNRTALQEQIIHTLENDPNMKCLPRNMCFDKTPGKIFWYKGSCTTITILTYQAVLNWDDYANSYYYIVLDEAHFFLEDALFNPLTGMILERMARKYYNAVWIMMSATLYDVTMSFGEVFHQYRPRHVQQQLFDARYREEIIAYSNTYSCAQYRLSLYTKEAELISRICKAPDDGKWLIFVSSKKAGDKLKQALTDAHKRAVFLTANSKKSAIWDSLTSKLYFKENVLITTKVLDNGVSIIDPAVKHIALPFCYWIDFKQMLGRLRVSSDQVVNVYAYQPTIQQINTRLTPIREQIAFIESFYKNSVRGPDVMRRYLQRLWLSDKQYLRRLFYINYARSLVPNPLAYKKAKLMKNFYEGLAKNYQDETYYSNMIKYWMGLSPETVILPATSKWDFSDLTSLIRFFLENDISGEDDQEVFYQVFQVLYKRQCFEAFRTDPEKLNQALHIRKRKKHRKPTINKSLAMLELPYIVKTVGGSWRLYRK